jgi:hypothetical protein
MYELPIKILVSTSKERQEYSRLIKEYSKSKMPIRRLDWNFPEWLVHKRYTEQGWKYPDTWYQEQYMTKEQYPLFFKYQTMTFGTGKPDLFFYKLKGKSVQNKFVEVKTGCDVLSGYQKYFLREFVCKRKLFDFELVYVVDGDTQFSDSECVRPPIQRKWSKSTESWIKSSIPPDEMCRFQWDAIKEKRDKKIEETFESQYDTWEAKNWDKIKKMNPKEAHTFRMNKYVEISQKKQELIENG